MARRDEGEYRGYSTEKQRRQRGCPARELCEPSRFQGTRPVHLHPARAPRLRVELAADAVRAGHRRDRPGDVHGDPPARRRRGARRPGAHPRRRLDGAPRRRRPRPVRALRLCRAVLAGLRADRRGGRRPRALRCGAADDGRLRAGQRRAAVPADVGRPRPGDRRPGAVDGAGGDAARSARGRADGGGRRRLGRLHAGRAIRAASRSRPTRATSCGAARSRCCSSWPRRAPSRPARAASGWRWSRAASPRASAT